MARVICPFCLKHHDFTAELECPEYGKAVPPTYVENYSKVPPLWLVTVGFSQHGKTTYLAALTLMLEKISLVWENVHYRPLNQDTIDRIRQMRREAMRGELPPTNPKGTPLPLLFNVYNLPESGSRCLVMYDVAGEIYNSLSEVRELVTPIKQVGTTWFLVSIEDLHNDQEGKNINDLFHAYLSGMESLHVDLKGRNLIVIYTKADQVSFTREIKDYLRTDPFQGLTLPEANIPDFKDFSLLEYTQKMLGISDRLEDYTRRRVNGGAAFIPMVKESGMKLIFCVTSALGQSPDETSKRLREDALRYRVLDPLLWAISLEIPPEPKPIGLVVDASSQSHALYGSPIFEIWENLSHHGALTTYYLGQTLEASHPGQHPPETPPRIAHQRLIGPILEKVSPDTRFVVVTTGPILDLVDFYDSPWRDRLLLVLTEEEQQHNWPHQVFYRAGDRPSVLIDNLLRL